MVDKIIALWYTMDTNYCPTVEYAKDYYLDWILDWYEFWTKTNWHSVCVINDWERKIKISYKGRKNPNWDDVNIYELKNPLAKITYYWPRLYVYTKVKKIYEEIKRLNEIKAKCNVIIDHLGELWNMVNDKNFQVILHYTAENSRKKIDDANEELKKYLFNYLLNNETKWNNKSS